MLSKPEIVNKEAIILEEEGVKILKVGCEIEKGYEKV